MSNQSYRIAAVSIRGYKRVTEVDIEPDADANWILIAGNNTNGKSSVLEAIDVALGGKRAQLRDPVHHDREGNVLPGFEQARVGVELVRLSDGSTMSIERVIEQDGVSKLKLLIDGALAKSPQAALDDLIGGRFLDPFEFMRLKPPAQRGALLAIIDKEGKLSQLDQRRKNIFDKRTETGREIVRAEGELARLPQLVTVPDLIDVAQLAAERADFAEKQRAGDALGAVHERKVRDRVDAQRAVEKQAESIRELEATLSQARVLLANKTAAIDPALAAEREALKAVTDAGARWAAGTSRREQLDADLARATQDNKRAAELQHENDRRARAQQAADALTAQRTKQTEALDKIDAAKQQFLKEATLPVPGLDFDDDGLKLNGAPFEQASSAEQIRVAVGIAASAASHLDDIMVRNAALLDDTSLELLKEVATEKGLRLWLEVIRPVEGAIIIENGKVRS